ncbi:MAG: tripartite tricarboxylate transporter permease [Nitrospinae bacterium]|nr:tripartite tricarboxylate transporter permease [Nitrospinota bacterium]
MEILGNLFYGLGVAVSPQNLLMALFGVILGVAIGAMPGLGSVNGVAILLPITFAVPPTSAIIFLAAIYYGAMYGGAISSITLNIPGASTAVATTFDGYPLARRGKAADALVTAAVASFIGGTISIVLFTFFAPPLAEFALRFGPPEEFAVVLLAYATFAGLGGESPLKTIIATMLGLLMSTVGTDIVSGSPRLIFGGITGFYHGINFLVLAIGIYGVGEIFYTLEEGFKTKERYQAKLGVAEILSTLKRLTQCTSTIMRGSLLGFFVGMLPAAGATPASFMSYSIAKRFAKKPEEFGKGALEGVAAPECANNAASTGSMLPMLTLGIPGSPTTAVMLGALFVWGLVPGPRLFVENAEFVWGLTGSLYIANTMAVIVAIFAVPIFIWMLRMPMTILAPIILVVCAVGGFSPTQDMFDVYLMFIFGAVGYIFRKLDYPLAPMVLALVLGGLTERTFRQSMIMSHGSPGIFFDFAGHPIAAVLMMVSAVLFVLPLVPMILKFRVSRAGTSS